MDIALTAKVSFLLNKIPCKIDDTVIFSKVELTEIILLSMQEILNSTVSKYELSIKNTRIPSEKIFGIYPIKVYTNCEENL